MTAVSCKFTTLKGWSSTVWDYSVSGYMFAAVPDQCADWCKGQMVKNKGSSKSKKAGGPYGAGVGADLFLDPEYIVGTMLSNKARDIVRSLATSDCFFEGAERLYQKAAEVSASFASGIGGGWRRFVSHQRCLFQPDRRSSFLRSFSYSALFRSSTHSDQGNLWTDCIWLQSVLKPTNYWSTLVPVCGLQ